VEVVERDVDAISTVAVFQKRQGEAAKSVIRELMFM
jgi:hypothetical protein